MDTIEVDVEVDPVNGTSDETDLAENSDDFFAFIYPYFLNRDPSSFGAWLVFMEMSLALIGIILNLTVLISIKEKESLSKSTVTIVLANLCFANLVSAVFVKSIAVIYHGYAVATSRWRVELAFCALYTLTSRATWAVFPYTIVVLCWHGLANRVGMLFVSTDTDSEAGLSAVAASGYITGVAAMGGVGDPVDQEMTMKNLGKSVSIEEPHPVDEPEPAPAPSYDDDDDDEFSEGLTARQKSALGFIWSAAFAYAIMSEEILSKERDILCSVRSDLSIKLNMISLLVAIGIPLLIGPIMCPLGHILLSVLACLKDAVTSSSPQPHHDSSDTKSTILECGLIFAFILVFLIFYPTHMYVVEVYLGSIKTQFAFMSFKYCFGCLHLILLPMLILIIRKDICKAAIETYVKKSPANENEITYEEFQKNTGIGVNVNG